MKLRPVLFLGVLVALAACDSGVAPTPPGGSGPLGLQYVGGSAQPGTAGYPLADSLSVRVVDPQGRGVAQVAVRFTATAGGGHLSPASAVTNAHGYARAAWVLGPQAGDNVAEAASEVDAGSPVVFRVRGDPPQTEVVASTLTTGAYHSCGITGGGAGFCWGRNAEGSLGDGSLQDRGTPVPISGGLTLASVSGGIAHSCGLTREGVAYCWGDNAAGQLGDGSHAPRTSPTRVATAARFASISAGWSHTCALTYGGHAYCWGGNDLGQLGTGSGGPSTAPLAVHGDLRFVSLDVGGGNHGCGRTADGTLYCWGSNSSGQLGLGTSVPHVAAPVRVATALVFRTVDTGWEHSCGIATDNRAYCWGLNQHGQLGDGTTISRNLPTSVALATSLAAVEAGTAYHTCALTAAGAAYCWGANEAGELGDGTFIDRSTPVLVGGRHDFVAIGGGDFHSCARARHGGLYCWGENSAGQLGDGSWTRRTLPVAVAGGSFSAVRVRIDATRATPSASGPGSPVPSCPNRRRSMSHSATTLTPRLCAPTR
jgi:alpha-tubulin suppressor-like RCC1 family protein